MGRKRKTCEESITFGNLEFSYRPGFERDWAEIVAGLIFTQIKHQMQEGEREIP